MCTISVVPAAGDRGWRLMINRDERRTRPVAWPPVNSRVDESTMIGPVDSHALGTWVAATDAGFAYAVMNVTPVDGLLPRAGSISRGAIIPSIAGADGLAGALRRLRSMALTPFAPFRLIVTGGREIAWGHWDGRTLRSAIEPLMRPRLFASSSLGDHLVAGPRQELLERLLQQEQEAWRAQDRLHVHAWPDRRHLSVNMSRRDACTVSRTSIVAGECAIEMTYVPYVEGWPGPAMTRTLTLAHARPVLAGVA